MGKIRILQLSTDQKKSLQHGYRRGKSHGFRQRCQVVLLNSEGRSCKEIGGIMGMNQVSVSHWLNRYETEGIGGLTTKPGRGRKPLLSVQLHGPQVHQAVKQERHQIHQTKELLEGQLGRQFSVKTLQRFLKNLRITDHAVC